MKTILVFEPCDVVPKTTQYLIVDIKGRFTGKVHKLNKGTIFPQFSELMNFGYMPCS